MRRVGHRRFALVALASALAVAGFGCGDDGTDTQSATTNPPAAEPTDTTRVPADPERIDDALPIGDDDSPYWVAHDLPDGYEIVDVRAPEEPPIGEPMKPMATSSYNEASKGSDDPNIHVSTIEWTPTETERAEFDTALEANNEVELSTVRGHRALQFPMHDDGREYGTTLLWEERPGLWIQVEAADPFPSDVAYAVAEGVEPFPEDQWDDLVLGLDTSWVYEFDVFDTDDTATVGEGDAGGRTVQVDAILPARWHDVPVERRVPCARLTVDGAAMAEPACDRMRWYLRDGQTYLLGVVGAELDGATVEVVGEDRSVNAVMFPDPDGHPVTYWVANLGDAGCSEYLVSLDHTDDALDSDARPNGGPEAGCGLGMPPGEPVIDGLPPDSATLPTG